MESHEKTTAWRTFFNGAGLPVFLLMVALIYEMFLLAVLFAPPGSGPWSQFSEEFKVWCFSYDPRTGGMEWGAVWIMLLEPPVLALIAGFIYRRNLVELFQKGGGGILKHWKAAAAGVLISSGALFGLSEYARLTDSQKEILPFPGERIRTRISPPELRLADQNGKEISLETLRGKVVLLTGVYATCSTACPEILRTMKNVIEEVPEEVRHKLVAVAVSLDPENDNTTMMQAVATAYQFPQPGFHYINGDAETVRAILHRLGFSAVRNQETGAIDHANLFILFDVDGYIAYRFNLDARHEPWIHEAVEQLMMEVNDAAVVANVMAP